MGGSDCLVDPMAIRRGPRRGADPAGRATMCRRLPRLTRRIVHGVNCRITFRGSRRGARHERLRAMYRQTTPSPSTAHQKLCAVYSGARRRRAEARTTLLYDAGTLSAIRTQLPSLAQEPVVGVRPGRGAVLIKARDESTEISAARASTSRNTYARLPSRTSADGSRPNRRPKHSTEAQGYT